MSGSFSGKICTAVDSNVHRGIGSGLHDLSGLVLLRFFLSCLVVAYKSIYGLLSAESVGNILRYSVFSLRAALVMAWRQT